MKRALKIFGVVVLVVIVAVTGWAAYHWRVLSAFPGLPSGYEAKELCSCLFVEERSPTACEDFIRQSVVSIDQRNYDMQAKTVTVTALWTTRKARWVSPRHGCVLESS